MCPSSRPCADPTTEAWPAAEMITDHSCASDSSARSLRRKNQVSTPWVGDLDNLWSQNGLRNGAAKCEGSLRTAEGRDEYALRGKQRKRTKVHARDDCQRSQRTNEQFMQIVAGYILHHAAAALSPLAPSPVTNSMHGQGRREAEP